MSTYSNSFLIRDNLQDTGSNSETPWWVSPDIICYGTNTLTPATASADYSQDLNQAFVNGQANNIYIRAKNIGGATASGTAILYAAPASLFLTPASWLEISTEPVSFQDTSNSTNIAPGEVCLSQTPFVWQGLPTGGHFCLVSIGNTNGVAFPIPASFSSNAEYAAWIQDNPNVSQRNLNFSPIKGSTANFTVTLGNMNSDPANFMIVLSQGTPGTNFPNTTYVSVSINDSRLSPNPYAPNAQEWSTNSGVAFQGLTIPGNVNGTPGNPLMTLNVTIILKSGTFKGMAPLIINFLQIPPSSPSAAESRFIKPHTIASATKPGTTEVQNAILLGSCTYNLS